MSALRTDVDSLMAQHQVQGLALAVIDGGRVTRVETWGWRNVARREPLAATTVMYGASLTKTAFAYMMMQLVDEGRLDLDASIATILPKPLPEYEDYTDLQGDDRWRALTPRILLMHASGFANFRWLEPDDPAVEMMTHVVDLPRGEGAVDHRVDPGMPLPSTYPGSEVISSAYRGDTKGRAMDAGLENLVTAVADDRQHMSVPIWIGARCMPPMGVECVEVFRPRDNSDLLCEFGLLDISRGIRVCGCRARLAGL
jgi:hypothetical protein